MGHGLVFSWDVEYPYGVILNPRRVSAIDHAVDPALHNAAASIGRPVDGSLLPWRTYRRTLEYDVRRWNEVNADPAGHNGGVRVEHLIAWTINDEDELRCLVKLRLSASSPTNRRSSHGSCGGRTRTPTGDVARRSARRNVDAATKTSCTAADAGATPPWPAQAQPPNN